MARNKTQPPAVGKRKASARVIIRSPEGKHILCLPLYGITAEQARRLIVDAVEAEARRVLQASA